MDWTLLTGLISASPRIDEFPKIFNTFSLVLSEFLITPMLLDLTCFSSIPLFSSSPYIGRSRISSPFPKKTMWPNKTPRAKTTSLGHLIPPSAFRWLRFTCLGILMFSVMKWHSKYLLEHSVRRKYCLGVRKTEGRVWTICIFLVRVLMSSQLTGLNPSPRHCHGGKTYQNCPSPEFLSFRNVTGGGGWF